MNFEKTAMRVSRISIIWNFILSGVKLVAGILANSGAMISDAIHSASDVLSSVIVIIGVKISSKESDQDHPYGHERLECVAAIVLATVLAGTGIGIGWKAILLLKSGAFSTHIPGELALWAAVLSILVKEAMYWYTRHYARIIDSSALMADAWHHRSDALSSVGALVGIGAARRGYPVMEPIASLIICIFIEKAAIDIFRDAIDKMVDKSCDSETEKRIRAVAESVEGVKGVDVLRTRVFGNKIYVDMEISADGEKPLKETHAIAENVHDAIENNFPKVKHIMVHVNPFQEFMSS